MKARSSRLAGQPVEQRPEFERPEEFDHFLPIEALDAAAFKLERHIDIGDDEGKLAAQECLIARFLQLAAKSGWHGVKVRVDVFQRGVLLQEVDGRLFAHTAHARYVVRAVADDRFIIRHLFGADAELFDDLLRAEVIGVRQPAAGEPDHDILIRQLEQIAVSGKDDHPDALRSRLLGDGSQHIVGLKALGFEDRDFKSLDHFPDSLQL